MKTIKNKFLMWTDIEIIIYSSLPEEKVLKDIEKSFDIFSNLEKEFSRFDENSDLSRLNKNKSLEVSDIFIEVLELSKEIYKNTDWFFNPLVNISNIWYSNSFSEKNFVKTNIENNIDFNSVEIIWNKVILQENQNLDLGWIVKWFAVDKIKEFLRAKKYSDFIINAGWDMYIKSNDSPKTIAIDSPKNNWDIFALLDLQNISLSTSGTYKRKWEIEDEKFNHILNPKNSQNNNEIKSISLIWNKCYITDSYATSCIAMWIERSLTFLKKEKIDWVIIWENDDVYKVWDLEKYNFEII